MTRQSCSLVYPAATLNASAMLAGCIRCLTTRSMHRHCHKPATAGTAHHAPRHAGHAPGAIAGGFVRAWQEAPCDSQQLDATLYCAVQRKCEVWFYARQGCTAAKSPARPLCTSELNHCELGDHHSSWPTRRQRPQHTHHSKACVVCSWAAPNCQPLPIGLDTDPVNTISNANQAAPPELTALPVMGNQTADRWWRNADAQTPTHTHPQPGKQEQQNTMIKSDGHI